MNTHQPRPFPRLLAAAILTIGAAAPLGAGAEGVAVQTNLLELPVYLQAGSLAMSAGAAVPHRSGIEVAEQTNALEVPFYLLPDNTGATRTPRAKVEGREIAGTTNALEVPPYLQPRM